MLDQTQTNVWSIIKPCTSLQRSHHAAGMYITLPLCQRKDILGIHGEPGECLQTHLGCVCWWREMHHMQYHPDNPVPAHPRAEFIPWFCLQESLHNFHIAFDRKKQTHLALTQTCPSGHTLHLHQHCQQNMWVWFFSCRFFWCLVGMVFCTVYPGTCPPRTGKNILAMGHMDGALYWPQSSNQDAHELDIPTIPIRHSCSALLLH